MGTSPELHRGSALDPALKDLTVAQGLQSAGFVPRADTVTLRAVGLSGSRPLCVQESVVVRHKGRRAVNREFSTRL